jgi:hypothetical protein
MDTLKTKHVESKFFNLELFQKYIENDVNTSKIYFRFFCVFHYFLYFKRKLKRRVKNRVMTKLVHEL